MKNSGLCSTLLEVKDGFKLQHTQLFKCSNVCWCDAHSVGDRVQ